MMFYNYHTMHDSKQKESSFFGLLTAPFIDNVKPVIENQVHLSSWEGATCFFSVKKNHDIDHAFIKLVVQAKDGYIVDLGGVELCTVNFNCGVIHLSNLFSNFRRKGFGTLILKEVIHWAERAGYTLIICNTAGLWQNRAAGKLFKHVGFKAFGRKYKNKRSNNTNVWLAYKM